MGWSIGYDSTWKRDIGYGVPAYCDHPGCMAEIDRGLSYVCGSEPYGGDLGCGLYFCGKHLLWAADVRWGEDGLAVFVCARCYVGDDPFEPAPEHPRWIVHKLHDKTWQVWRQQHPKETRELQK